MKNKIKMLTMAFLLLAGFTLQAQRGGGGRNMNPEQRAEAQTTQMTEKLALSEAQSGKVKAINLKYANKMKDAREEADGDWSAMRETMGAIREEHNKELETVLTKDQVKSWKEFQAEQRANRGGGMGRGDQDGGKAAPADAGSGKKSKKGKKAKKADADSDSNNK